MDAAEFEQAVNSFYESLYRFAIRLARSEADACDLTQETFYRLAAKGHQLRDKSRLKTWLFTTLYREFLGSRRRESTHPHSDLDTAERELPPVAPTIVRALDGATVRQSLAEVDEIYRAPLTLFYLEDHSYAEIAEILDVRIGTVMSRLSRGKTVLRQLLRDKTGEAENKFIRLDQFSALRKNHDQPRS